jgi:hypothetical protein
MKEIEQAETLIERSHQLEARVREALEGGLSVASEESLAFAREIEKDIQNTPMPASLRRNFRQRCEVISMSSQARAICSSFVRTPQQSQLDALPNGTQLQDIVDLKNRAATLLVSKPI